MLPQFFYQRAFPFDPDHQNGQDSPGEVARHEAETFSRIATGTCTCARVQEDERRRGLKPHALQQRSYSRAGLVRDDDLESPLPGDKAQVLDQAQVSFSLMQFIGGTAQLGC